MTKKGFPTKAKGESVICERCGNKLGKLSVQIRDSILGKNKHYQTPFHYCLKCKTVVKITQVVVSK